MKRNNLPKTLSLVAIILSMVACSGLPFTQDSSGTATSQAVTDIPYCDADSSVLCLISFGVDNKGQMFINLYKPKLSISNFYLKVQYDQTENVYECEAVKDFKKYISCTGEQIPLEEQIDIKVYLSDGDTLIASGTFVVSALAIATPVLVIVTEGTATTPLSSPGTRTRTPQVTPSRTLGTASVTLTPRTGTPAITTPTATRTPVPTVSYPNP